MLDCEMISELETFNESILIWGITVSDK